MIVIGKVSLCLFQHFNFGCLTCPGSDEREAFPMWIISSFYNFVRRSFPIRWRSQLGFISKVFVTIESASLGRQKHSNVKASRKVSVTQKLNLTINKRFLREWSSLKDDTVLLQVILLLLLHNRSSYAFGNFCDVNIKDVWLCGRLGVGSMGAIIIRAILSMSFPCKPLINKWVSTTHLLK